MDQIRLGKTRITIPRVFLGTGSWDFHSGCLQEKIPPKKYAEILKKAYKAGINFWDTSDDYHTHPHVRLGMAEIPREDLVIATKTYATTAKEALRVLRQGLAELHTPFVDIFYLHSVDTVEGFQKRIHDALEGLKQAKNEGKIKAIGLSTHTIHVLEIAAEHPDLDVLFTNFNPYEVHMDASLEWYSRCLKQGYEKGKGILVMKTLGEGRLANRAKETIQFNLSQPFIHGVCVGIAKEEDLAQALEAWRHLALQRGLEKTSE